jgi:hypothetical protein
LKYFFRCDEGFDAHVDVAADNAAKKFVADMFYEARLRAVIKYHAEILGEKVSKTTARSKYLRREEYMQVSNINAYYYLDD